MEETEETEAVLRVVESVFQEEAEALMLRAPSQSFRGYLTRTLSVVQLLIRLSIQTWSSPKQERVLQVGTLEHLVRVEQPVLVLVTQNTQVEMVDQQ